MSRDRHIFYSGIITLFALSNAHANPNEVSATCGSTKADVTLVMASPIESSVFHHIDGVSHAWSYRRIVDDRLCAVRELPNQSIMTQEAALSIEQLSLMEASGSQEGGSTSVLSDAQGFISSQGCATDISNQPGFGATQITPHVAITSYESALALQQGTSSCFYPRHRGESVPPFGRSVIAQILKSPTLGSTIRGIGFFTFRNPVELPRYPRLEFAGTFTEFLQAYHFGSGGTFNVRSLTLGPQPAASCVLGIGGPFGLLLPEDFGQSMQSYGGAFRDSQVSSSGTWRGHGGGNLVCPPILGAPSKKYEVLIPANPSHYQLINGWVQSNASAPPSLEIEGIDDGNIVRTNVSYPVHVTKLGTTSPVSWIASGTSGVPSGDSGSIQWNQVGQRHVTVRLTSDAQVSRTKFVTVIAPGAVLSASPQQVVVPLGTSGSTQVSWSTQDLEQAQVLVSVDGATATDFGTALSGSEPATWIEPGRTYEFTLRGIPVGGGQWEQFGSTTVTGVEAAVEISIHPAEETLFSWFGSSPVSCALESEYMTRGVSWSSNLPSLNVYRFVQGVPIDYFNSSNGSTTVNFPENMAAGTWVTRFEARHGGTTPYNGILVDELTIRYECIPIPIPPIPGGSLMFLTIGVFTSLPDGEPSVVAKTH
jgi:hypothetical protein